MAQLPEYELMAKMSEELDRLRQQKAQLLEVVKAIEWKMGRSGWRCPWCGNLQEQGHAPDCLRQVAIAAAEGDR
jgi:hypothetical protein